MTAERKLPLMRILTRAFVLPWEQRGQLFRVVTVPLAAIIALSIIQLFALLPETPLLSWAWQIAYSLCVAWLAVSIHRHLLVDAGNTKAEDQVARLRRVVLYAIAVMVIWALFLALAAVISGIYDKLLIGESKDSMQRLELLLEKLRGALVATFVAAIAVAFLAGRFCLLLPAISIEESAGAALRAARGNTLRLTVVFCVLPLALGLLNQLLYTERSTEIELVALCVLGAIFMVIEIVALSLSWRELTSPLPPPKDPRA